MTLTEKGILPIKFGVNFRALFMSTKLRQRFKFYLPVLLILFWLFPQILPAADTNTFSPNTFFPLWQKNPPNAVDTVLIYQGDPGRLAWTPDQLAPYVSYQDPRGGEKWLFDGFLFIEFHNGTNTYSAEEGQGRWQPANQQVWLDLLAKNFEPGHGVPALEEDCAATEKRIGTPLRPRQVILTLPEPVTGFTNWGELNGRRLDFSVTADRVAACDWYIGQALEKWRSLSPQHLTLAGFYFVPEDATQGNPQMLPLVAQKIHDRGLKFFWIPFWAAPGNGDWKKLGFDLASQQPNYFFNTNLPESRLQDACDFGHAHGMGMEMEFNDRLFRQPDFWGPRFEAYLKAFTQNGVKDSASISYYEGGGALLQLAQPNHPQIHYYDQLAQWVTYRQQIADEQFQRAHHDHSAGALHPGIGASP